MHDVLVLAIKGVAGGGLVVTFALLSQALSPKRFAGLFSAAPAVALAGLTVVLIDRGAHAAHENAVGMIAGGPGMVAYALAVVPMLRTRKASAAAALAMAAWLLVGGLCILPFVLA